jgi:hypothetical protein
MGIEQERFAKGQVFVKKYLTENHSVDILHLEFIDQFVEATGYPVRFQPFGANTCRGAGRTLSKMYQSGILTRGIINLGYNWMPGFPKWVYVYRLKERST